MVQEIKLLHTSAGINQTANQAVSCNGQGLVGFASHQAVGLVSEKKIVATLHNSGGTGAVTCVHFVAARHLVCGSSDSRLTQFEIKESAEEWECVSSHKHGSGSLNSIGSVEVDDGRFLVATASPCEGFVAMWQMDDGRFSRADNISTKADAPTLCLEVFSVNKTAVVAVGSTDYKVYLYKRSRDGWEAAACLCGHTGWIRSVKYCRGQLATGGQDGVVRIWEFARENKTQILTSSQHGFDETTSIQLRSVLASHSDMVYCLAWNGPEQLVSSSADHTLIVWKHTDGVWMQDSRLSTGSNSDSDGYVGVVIPDSKTIVGWCKALMMWKDEAGWKQQCYITGHIAGVYGIDWSRQGGYLVSVSHDRTARVIRNNGTEWLEVGRPQVHGYDIKSVVCLNGVTFASGSDEKVVRVFEAPRGFLNGRQCTGVETPTLGLSNKVTVCGQDSGQDTECSEAYLNTQTLWPEINKLYGHGHEIAGLAFSDRHQLIASSAKATQKDDSRIRMYRLDVSGAQTSYTMTELEAGHDLTVTAMAFNPVHEIFLSVSRDRSWIIWQIENNGTLFRPFQKGSKAHQRIIWDASWNALGEMFGTASRDKKARG